MNGPNDASYVAGEVPLIVHRALRTSLHDPHILDSEEQDVYSSWVTRALSDPTRDEPTEYAAGGVEAERSLITSASSDPTRDEHVDWELGGALPTFVPRSLDEQTGSEAQESCRHDLDELSTLKTSMQTDPTIDEPTSF